MPRTERQGPGCATLHASGIPIAEIADERGAGVGIDEDHAVRAGIAAGGADDACVRGQQDGGRQPIAGQRGRGTRVQARRVRAAAADRGMLDSLLFDLPHANARAARTESAAVSGNACQLTRPAPAAERFSYDKLHLGPNDTTRSLPGVLRARRLQGSGRILGKGR